MRTKNKTKMLLGIGVSLYIFSCFLLFGDNGSTMQTVSGYFMSAFTIPLLLFLLAKFISVNMKDKYYLVCVFGSLMVAVILWGFWIWISSYIADVWINVINNIFSLLIGCCVTCLFEVNNNAGLEIEEELRK